MDKERRRNTETRKRGRVRRERGTEMSGLHSEGGGKAPAPDWKVESRWQGMSAMTFSM